MSKHLVAAGRLLDVDPEAAYQHAKYALNRAGRIGAVREAMGLVAYQLEKYDEAVRELRTHRRITGSTDNLALLADAERGRGKPDKALELVDEVDPTTVPPELYTELMIVAAGAHTDKGHVKAARALLEKQSFTGNASGATVRLMSAYADILRIDGDAETADKYEELARRTAKATNTFFGDEEPDPNADVEIFTIEEIEDEPAPVEPGADSDTDAGSSSDADSEAGAGSDTDAGTGADSRSGTGTEDSGADATGSAVSAPGALAADAPEDPAADDSAPAAPSGEFDPDTAPRSFQEEIEAELDEILAEAGFDEDPAAAGTEDTGIEDTGTEDTGVEAEVASTASTEAGSTIVESEAPAPQESAPDAPTEDTGEIATDDAAANPESETSGDGTDEGTDDATATHEATDTDSDTATDTDSDADRRRRTDDDEEMTAPLFDL